MKRIVWYILLVMMIGTQARAESDWKRIVNLRGSWKFSIGDNPRWANKDLDDRNWESIRVPDNWESQGFHGYDGYAWYRKTFDGDDLEDYKGSLVLYLGYIDDIDEVFINGRKIGGTGSFPPNYHTAYNAKREYYIPQEVIDYDGENVIAVRVFDEKLGGGIVSGGDIGIYYNEEDKDFAINLRGVWELKLLPSWKLEGNNEALMKENLIASESFRTRDGWEKVTVPQAWERQGFDHYDGGAVYRKVFTVPRELQGEDLILYIGAIDDNDWTYLNGKRIGTTIGYDRMRAYTLTPDMYKIGGLNVLTIFVEDSTGLGGIYLGPVGLIQQVEFTRFMRWR